MYVSHNVMTRVKIYFHRHHCECVDLPTVPVSKHHQSYTSFSPNSSERTKIPYSQANQHTVSYTEKEKIKIKSIKSFLIDGFRVFDFINIDRCRSGVF